MGKERKFHDIIERDCSESKPRIWERVNGELASAAPSVSERKISPRRIAAVAAAAIMLLAVGLAFLLPPLLNTDSRYSTQRDYAWYFTDDYLSDFAKTAPYRVLFFNWYAETDREEFYVDSVCRRRDTGEMICFKEEIYHLETDTYYTLYFVPRGKKSIFSLFLRKPAKRQQRSGGGRFTGRRSSIRSEPGSAMKTATIFSWRREPRSRNPY